MALACAVVQCGKCERMWGFYRLETAAQAEAMLLHELGLSKDGKNECVGFIGLGQREMR